MPRTGLLIMVLALILPSGYPLRISQEILFEDEETVSIRLRLYDGGVGNISLFWNTNQLEILDGPHLDVGGAIETRRTDTGIRFLVNRASEKEDALISFSLRYSLAEGRFLEFPIPTSDLNVTKHEVSVLLPEGWTASKCSPECERAYDVGSRRIRLSWENADSQPCGAVLSIPGMGEGAIKKKMRWIMVRGYLFWGGLFTLMLAGLVVAIRMLT